MSERKVKIEIICTLSDYEDDQNLLDYIKYSLNEVIDGHISSVTLNGDNSE